MVSKTESSRESIIHLKQRGGGHAQGVNFAGDVIFGGFVTDDIRKKNPNAA
jgi:hypothetical protein